MIARQLIVALLLVASVFAALPSKATLRFGEVDEQHLAANSISAAKLQQYSVGNEAIQQGAVTNSKLASFSVDDRVLGYNAVTARSTAVDLVRVYFGEPTGPFTVKPRTTVNGDINQHIPAYSDAYRAEARAKGPGVILGWYPNQNGHLLRYQADRALRTLQCSDSVWVYDSAPIGCSTNCDDVFFFDNIFCNTGCSILQFNFHWEGNIPCNSDPFCRANPPPNPNRPDRCGSFTSVGDISDPQEGIPIYSPSVERITIDDTGLVAVYFFGQGSPYTAVGTRQPEIDITVVVLLNNQVGV